MWITMRNWPPIGKRNMESKILIDTNVLLDYLLIREPFCKAAEEILMGCKEGRVRGCIAAHSVTDIFYILRKDYSVKERREILYHLCSVLEVEGIDKGKLLSGLQNEKFVDFEDCLQMECAKACGVEYIITRETLI